MSDVEHSRGGADHCRGRGRGAVEPDQRTQPHPRARHLPVAAAVASDVCPALGQLSVTTVQRVVTVALAVILFDGEMQIGWRWFRGAAREGAARRPPSRAETLSGGSLPCCRSRPWPTSRSPPIRLDFQHDQGAGPAPCRRSGRHPARRIGPWLPAGSSSDAAHRRHRQQSAGDLLGPDPRRRPDSAFARCLGGTAPGWHVGAA
jgi:hypothetical protein